MQLDVTVPGQWPTWTGYTNANKIRRRLAINTLGSQVPTTTAGMCVLGVSLQWKSRNDESVHLLMSPQTLSLHDYSQLLTTFKPQTVSHTYFSLLFLVLF